MTSLKIKKAGLSCRPALRGGIALVAALVLVLVQTQISWAHARLKSATIQPNAVITSVPASLTLTFTEETSPTQTRLQVLDSTGKAVDRGDLKVNGDTATVSLGTLTNGKYSVKFRTFTEDDSNIVDGEYSFTVATTGTASSGAIGNANQTEGNARPSGVPATGGGLGWGSNAIHSDDSSASLDAAVILAVTVLFSAALILLGQKGKGGLKGGRGRRYRR